MKPLNLFQKINKVQQQVKSVFKGSKVAITQNSSYMAVSHDDVTALLHDPLADVGIVAFPNMETAEVENFEVIKEYNGKETRSFQYRVKVWASVTFYDSDSPESFLVTKCFSYAIDSGDKATGKAYSMAIKYCYLKTFMLESLDEEESRDYDNSYKNNNYNNAPQNNYNKPVQNNPKPQPSQAQINHSPRQEPVTQAKEFVKGMESLEERGKLIDQIKKLLGDLTAGESTEKKAKALTDVCGVGTFSALNLKTVDELKALTEKISEVILEKKAREFRENNKPSFKLK